MVLGLWGELQNSHRNSPAKSGQASLVLPIFTGVVELVSDFVVCDEGKPLSPEAARILVSYFLLLPELL